MPEGSADADVVFGLVRPCACMEKTDHKYNLVGICVMVPPRNDFILVTFDLDL